MTATGMDVVRAGLGIADIAVAPNLAALELGRAATRNEQSIFRILGARQVVQAALTAAGVSVRLGVIVDTLHAASMVAVAAAGPKRLRRGALVQATIASGFCIAGLVRRG